jgi:hypothetical protein
MAARILLLFMFAIGVVLWILCVVSQFLIIVKRKPGVGLFEPRFVFNPFFLQLGGRRYLTDNGIYWRNVSWISAILFITLCVLIPVLFESD